ncbi:nucleoside deaminase [Derxia gummosa]|uniref:Nucleoside deaminase n=1 Tax=Derxia gummosa DSM 723 TaxID=1121388 RepID=A0A8B6X8P4_9BURK|nr:nucleoside deaminase [Derxia gummosa]
MNDDISPVDALHLREAIRASRAAVAAGAMPFGAVLLTADGRVLTARNAPAVPGDRTGHAETNAVRDALAAWGAEALRGSTMYASGEPCPMCAAAMLWAGVRRVVFAGGSGVMAAHGIDTLRPGCAELMGQRAVAVVGPVLEAEAAAVYGEWASRP